MNTGAELMERYIIEIEETSLECSVVIKTEHGHVVAEESLAFNTIDTPSLVRVRALNHACIELLREIRGSDPTTNCSEGDN